MSAIVANSTQHAIIGSNNRTLPVPPKPTTSTVAGSRAASNKANTSLVTSAPRSNVTATLGNRPLTSLEFQVRPGASVTIPSAYANSQPASPAKQATTASPAAAAPAMATVSVAAKTAAASTAVTNLDTAWAAFSSAHVKEATTQNKTTYTKLFNQRMADGQTADSAAQFAEHMLISVDAKVRDAIMLPANWVNSKFTYKDSGGTARNLAEATALKEWTELGWDGLKKFLGNRADVTGKYLTTIAIEKLAEGTTCLAPGSARKDLNEFGQAIAKLSRETGQAFSKILEKAGSGDLAAIGGVIESIGIAYQVSLSNKTMDQIGGNMLVGARIMKAFGVGMNDTDLKAAAELAAATGTMFQKWAQDSGGNRNNAITQGVASFIAGLTGAAGLLTNSKTLGTISGTAWSATSLLSGWDPNMKLLDLWKDAKYGVAVTKIGDLGLHLAGNIVGGDAGALLNNLGDLFGIGADTGKIAYDIAAVAPDATKDAKAFQDWLDKGLANEVDLLKIGVRMMQAGFKFAGVAIPATVQTIIDQTVGVLSGPITAEAVRSAGVSVAWFVHDIIKLTGGSVKVAQETFASISNTISESAGTLGKVAGWGGTVVQAAYLLTDVFQNGWTHQNQIAGVNLGASVLGMMVGGIPGLAVSLPMAAVTAFIASRKIVSVGSLTSVKATGTKATFNLGMANGGGWTVNFPDVPTSNTSMWKSSGLKEYYVKTRFGTYGYSDDAIWVGIQGGNITVLAETSLGQTKFWMGSFPDGTKYLDVAKSTFDTMRSLRTIDGALADALNRVDIRNGDTVTGVKSLMTKARYDALFKAGETADGKAGATVRKFLTQDETPKNSLNSFIYGLSTDLKDFGKNVPKMVDYRYASFANKMAATQTAAGKSFNAWFDLFVDKNTVDPTPGRTAAIVDFIAKNDYLLDIPADVVAKISAKVTAGKLDSVANQAVPIAATYQKLLSDTAIQSLKMTTDQLLDVAQILVGPRS